MIKSTPELEAKIKASGVKVIPITLEQFLQTKLATKEEINYIYIKYKNNGNTSNRIISEPSNRIDSSIT
jgi:hypothetical protein